MVGQMICTLKASTEPGKPAGAETSASHISRVKGHPGREVELGERCMEIRDVEGPCGPERVGKTSFSTSKESTDFYRDLVSVPCASQQVPLGGAWWDHSSSGISSNPQACPCRTAQELFP